jgi:hypothetical protein
MLNTPIEIFDDVSSTSSTVTVSMTWTGAGVPPFSTRQQFMFRAKGSKFAFSSTDTEEPATASGNVTAADGTTFDLSNLEFASLDSVKSGELDVSH